MKEYLKRSKIRRLREKRREKYNKEEKRRNIFYLFWLERLCYMKLSKGMIKRCLIAITIIVTIPMLFVSYHECLIYNDKLIANQEHQISEVAWLLSEKIRGSFEEILEKQNAKNMNKSEQVRILNHYLQPIISQHSRIYPGYGMGIYSLDLESIVAIAPNFSSSRLKKITDPNIRKVYQTGKFQVVYVKHSVSWDSKPTMAVVYPIYHKNQIIGHVAASKKIEDINGECLMLLIKIILLTLLVWLASIATIIYIFYKLQSTVATLIDKIINEENDATNLYDFPELISVLNTVTSLRNSLKEEKKKEHELTSKYINEKEKLHQLIELCPVAVLVIDKEEKIQFINKVLIEAMPHFKGEDLMGQPYRKIADDLGVDYENLLIIRSMRENQEKEKYSRVLGKDWLCSSVPLRDVVTGDVTGAIAVFNDITEYEEIRKEMVKLDRLNLVGQMAAGVAHEIRNPMAAVKGYLQLVTKKVGKEYSGYFNIILEELDRANGIISDFLTLARNKHTNKKQHSLNDIVTNLYPLIYGEAVKSGVSVKLDLHDGIPSLSLNEKEIKQVILNLVRNAIESMDEKGKLTIATKVLNEKVQLVISDNGCGIPEENISKIFDPFYTDKDNGTGLGLAVCLGIIERHQGNIEVGSQEGVGTTFTVNFNIPI